MILVIVLAVFCVLLLFQVYALEKNLRWGEKQLKERREAASAAPLRLAAPNAAVEALMAQVNALLRDAEDERTDFRSREAALRRQIANVSHDLRTPLTSILGYLQLLEDPSLTEAQRKEYMNVVKSRAKVLQDLIAAFYDLSRLEAGEYPIAREKVDLRQVISELLAAFYSDLEGQFDVSVDLPDGLPQVWGDRSAMERVYANLIRNALEHGSGHLAVSAKAVEGGVETRFANGGADLREEDLPRVFDRFFTSDKTRSGRNTGLGLAIVKAICNQMEGEAKASLSGGEFTVILCWKV